MSHPASYEKDLGDLLTEFDETCRRFEELVGALPRAWDALYRVAYQACGLSQRVHFVIAMDVKGLRPKDKQHTATQRLFQRFLDAASAVVEASRTDCREYHEKFVHYTKNLKNRAESLHEMANRRATLDEVLGEAKPDG